MSDEHRTTAMRSIAVINQKGGVGKTTTCANLAHALALDGHRVTALDLDPQGHLSVSLGIDPRHEEGMDAVLLDGVRLESVVHEVRDRLRVVTCGPRLRDFESRHNDGAHGGTRLREALSGCFSGDEFVLIDSPPSSGLLVVNALYAADEALIPVSGDYLSLEGLSHLIATLRRFEQGLGHCLPFWITLTRFQERRRLPREVRDKLVEYFGGRLLATPIRETAALAECSGFGRTIFEYRGSSKAAEDFRHLAEDLVSGRTV